ncbi:type II secretion system GspH family protein [Patescibacteria group bacterium]|nr:type II secretion system GspH family protein [Patescibacteria group bacterium]
MYIFKNSTKGFTLIELLVVISIIALLASVILVSLNTAREKARNAAYLSQIREYRKALELYYGDNGQYPLINAQAYECIGFGHSGANCWSTSYVEGTELSTALAPYMTTFPVPGPTTFSNGPMYRDMGTNGASYQIILILEGTIVPCPVGIVSGTPGGYSGNTRCDVAP